MAQDIPAMTLAEVSAAIRRRDVSSVEAARACLAEIGRTAPRLNTFISVDADAALQAATDADVEIAAGRWRGPLHGVPMAHKDMFYRAGRVSTCGSKILRDRVAGITATIHRRLVDAGAVDMGTLNMSEFAAGPTGHNEHFGHCRNPWNPEHVSGGSSSGSGAAVAAHQIFASVGSDTGGSIRLPAAMCGVVGLKPTYGLVSRYGVMPRCWSLDVVGPLARTVQDCALLLQAIAGPDEDDGSTTRHGVPDYGTALAQSVKGLRIGVPSHPLFDAVDAEVRLRLDESLRAFKDAGARLVPLEFPDTGPIYHLTNLVNKAEAATLHAKWVRERRGDYSLSAVNRFEAGYHIPATVYLDALRVRGPLLERFVTQVFRDIDVVHLPAVGIPVPTVAATEIRSTADVPRLMETITRYTRWVNYLGLPALAVPCGFTGNGLPVAFQLLGRPFSEARLLAAGHAYQQLTDWHCVDPRERPEV